MLQLYGVFLHNKHTMKCSRLDVYLLWQMESLSALRDCMLFSYWVDGIIICFKRLHVLVQNGGGGNVETLIGSSFVKTSKALLLTQRKSKQVQLFWDDLLIKQPSIQYGMFKKINKSTCCYFKFQNFVQPFRMKLTLQKIWDNGCIIHNLSYLNSF